MKIAFCSSEVVPYAKTGGLADVAGALPAALEKAGQEITIIMPRYKVIDPKAHVIKSVNRYASKTTIGNRIQVYFIEHPGYFDRDGLYGDSSGDYPDNLDRYHFYCTKTLELLKELDLKVDILHVHDWQAALITAYLKLLHREDPFFKKMKTVLTIHNMAYQGVFPAQEFSKLGLDKKYFNVNAFEFFNQINLLKAGIVYADRVTTVSPSYAKEIQTEKFGCGLDGVLRQRKDKVSGILNGIDHAAWDPASDSYLERTYSSRSIEDKKINKKNLQAQLHLPQDEQVPLFGFVGRLTFQKGLDLIARVIDEVAKMDLQLVLQGVGEEKYHRSLKEWKNKYPNKIGVHLGFDEKTAHQVYAASDIFLIPSVYEPCGLSQMIALRYGVVPLVHKTGGLADTVVSYDSPNGHGNGFVFDQYDEKSLLRSIQQAVEVYKNRKKFSTLVEKAFRQDFSWDNSAQEYGKLYQQCLS